MALLDNESAARGRLSHGLSECETLNNSSSCKVEALEVPLIGLHWYQKSLRLPAGPDIARFSAPSIRPQFVGSKHWTHADHWGSTDDRSTGALFFLNRSEEHTSEL